MARLPAVRRAAQAASIAFFALLVFKPLISRPEAFYLIRHKTHLSYTLEAPSDFPLELRAAALVAAVKAALAAFT